MVVLMDPLKVESLAEHLAGNSAFESADEWVSAKVGLMALEKADLWVEVKVVKTVEMWASQKEYYWAAKTVVWTVALLDELWDLLLVVLMVDPKEILRAGKLVGTMVLQSAGKLVEMLAD